MNFKMIYTVLMLSMGKVDHMSGITVFGCKDSTVNFICERDSLVHIVRANYGRFSVSVCNVDAQQWDTNCSTEVQTTSIISKR